MARHFILAQSEVTARALGAWVELLGQPSLEENGKTLVDSRVLRAKAFEKSSGQFVDAFHAIHRKIEQAVRTTEGEMVVILVDSINPANLSAVGPPSGWDRLITLLILAFPEVRWVFGVLHGANATDADSVPESELCLANLQKWHCLPSLFAASFDPLFDGTGLRQWARQKSSETQSEKNPVAPWIPVRRQRAAAIDDEQTYAYFHAYTAYRFGFRAFAVQFETLGSALFKNAENGEEAPPSKPPFGLVFEDLFLNFPDRNEGQHLSNLESGRNALWPKLEQIPQRIFVTTGHRHTGDDEDGKREHNTRYMCSRIDECGQRRKRVQKPTGGMFDLWEESCLHRKLRWTDPTTKRRYRGKAEGFAWPPPPQTVHDGDTGHSAPGALLLVAEKLIDRCGSLMRYGVHSVEDAVRGAVMAGNALELLGDRTPTTGLAALSFKHQFEVLAECQFSGVEYHLQIKPRLAEIRAEVKAIGRWFSRSKHKEATLNAEMMIVNALVSIFQAHNQFDEEEICMNRVRHLHNTLWMRQRQRLPIPWRYAFYPVLRYSEFLLSSLLRFSTALALWVIGLSVLFHQTAKWIDIGEGDEQHPWGLAISTFFGTEPLTGSHPAWIALTTFAVLGGLGHLAIFISHLYRIVSRK